MPLQQSFAILQLVLISVCKVRRLLSMVSCNFCQKLWKVYLSIYSPDFSFENVTWLTAMFTYYRTLYFTTCSIWNVKLVNTILADQTYMLNIWLYAFRGMHPLLPPSQSRLTNSANFRATKARQRWYEHENGPSLVSESTMNQSICIESSNLQWPECISLIPLKNWEILSVLLAFDAHEMEEKKLYQNSK